jgi:glycosyltransferase involved in cell wall biosynthesis
MRLALVGAFAFPAPQGSQVYARDQALALRDAGAEVVMVCYGAGAGSTPPELEVVRIPRALSPRGFRSGPRIGKPLADGALALRLLHVHRRRRFDALIAHNAEAAAVGLTARALGGPPVVYVAHTLLEEELSAYAPEVARRSCDALGRSLDAAIVRRADATIALGSFAARRLGRVGRAPLAVIPPGIGAGAAPDREAIGAACARYGVEPGGFSLYAGNLDRYQEPELLHDLAARLSPHPLLVATHGPADRDDARLRIASVTPEDWRPLLHGAAVAVATRARRGGFPIKLLNYMEAGRAIVARQDQVDTLEHGESAWLLPIDADAGAFAHATRDLLADPDRRDALGRGARRAAAHHHHWPSLAARTLALVEKILGRSPRQRLPPQKTKTGTDDP